MKIHRSHPIAFAVSVAAAAVVIGAEITPKGAPPASDAAKFGEGVIVPENSAPPRFSPSPVTDAATPGEVVAVVNGDSIKRGELEEQFARAMAGRGMPADAIPADQKKAVLRMVLDDIISERLVNKACAGEKVSDAAVDAEFEKMRTARKATEEQVKKELAQMGMTFETLKTNIQKSMRQRVWLEGQIKGKAGEATDADAKGFYEKNPQHFDRPEMVRASHILFRIEAGASPEKVNATLKKAEGALGRAKKEDFAKLVGELSEEPGAAERGGDLNFFPRQGSMVEEFAAAAFKLKKDEISAEPVRSQFGYHIIKVTDRKAGGKQPFDEAKPQILAFLTGERKRKAIGEVIGALRAKADVKINLPAPEARVEVTTPPVSVPSKK